MRSARCEVDPTQPWQPPEEFPEFDPDPSPSGPDPDEDPNPYSPGIDPNPDEEEPTERDA